MTMQGSEGLRGFLKLESHLQSYKPDVVSFKADDPGPLY